MQLSQQERESMETCFRRFSKVSRNEKFATTSNKYLLCLQQKKNFVVQQLFSSGIPAQYAAAKKHISQVSNRQLFLT
jgi:hypothetical protein